MKWLPWNTGTQVTVVIIPVVGLTAMVLILNVVAPSSADVRVIKYVINVVPQVRGRVIEVPVEPNRLVRKGDVLFRIDPTPYQNEVRSLEARLSSNQAQLTVERNRVREVEARLVESVSGGQQLREELNAARAQLATLEPTRFGPAELAEWRKGREHTQRLTESDGGLMGHPRELSAADHGHFGCRHTLNGVMACAAVTCTGARRGKSFRTLACRVLHRRHDRAAAPPDPSVLRTAP
jgi:hypothetical protein